MRGLSQVEIPVLAHYHPVMKLLIKRMQATHPSQPYAS